VKTTRFYALAILLAASSLGCPKKSGTGSTGAGTPAPKATTAGGLVRTAATPIVVALPEPGNPVVAIRLVFRSGSVDDPKGKEGLAALTADVMAGGGTKKLSTAELVRALYPMAATLYSTTDREMTVFVGRCHKDHLATFLPMLADVLLEPRMDPKEFERLRTDAVNDLTLRLRTSDDENLGKELLETMLGAGHGYGHPPLGTESGLGAITLEDVESFRKKAFGQGRLTIGIAGGYDPVVFQSFQQRLTGLPVGDAPVTPPALPIAAERNVLIAEKPTASTAVSMGFNLDLKRGDPDFHELRMAMGWFGEHRQGVGRLFQEIREKRGLNYGNYAYVEDFREDGGTVFARNNIVRARQHFEMWIRPVKNENALFATRAALWQFDALLKNGIQEDEFREMRDWLVGYSRLWELTTDRRLGYAVDGVYYGTPEYLDSFRKSMAKMTAAQVNEAVKRRLSGKALQIAIVTADGAAFKELIVSNKPTPASYGDAKPPVEVTKDDPTIQTWPFDVTADHVKVIPVSEAFK
jgi:zinc protease